MVNETSFQTTAKDMQTWCSSFFPDVCSTPRCSRKR